MMRRSLVRQLIASQPVRWLLIAPAVGLLLYGVSATAWGMAPALEVGDAPRVTANYQPWHSEAAAPVEGTPLVAGEAANALNLGEPPGPQPDEGRPAALPTAFATATTPPDNSGAVVVATTVRVVPPAVAAPAEKAQPSPIPTNTQVDSPAEPAATNTPPGAAPTLRAPAQPTRTPVPSATSVPTNVPTHTAPPPTVTPTSTPPVVIAPTLTSPPPTWTSPPPTWTSAPPTNTLAPAPTDTQPPPPTATPDDDWGDDDDDDEGGGGGGGGGDDDDDDDDDDGGDDDDDD